MKTEAHRIHMPAESPQLARGVYRVSPDGPNGQVVLFVVDSAGHRVRITGELDAHEAPAVAEFLHAWLDARESASAQRYTIPPTMRRPPLRSQPARPMLRAI